ncbi:MAG: saccharopine dehydrogenase NADP-binding domain-containing protein [Candidatus Nezhaarchaeota archaeon]|nr:saccharopine dehydrogenase NADP-binding domain-containing protein [Candidatus Nezhaarchaeota archaeon]MCX8141350.1 saccharopine dehydrogenase NADP-binding domain-containing protein [Candidatus Nezhaarchaeota archaeon]MDW8049616.1 saccharopine dehydrogenase C-terminal domain-containing protein [Nitrososphaerota archaeon]
MSRFLVVGYGRVGRAVALDLKSCGHSVEVVDLRSVSDELVDGYHLVDASKDPHAIARLARNFDCTCGCLPGKLGYSFMTACAERGVKLVDVSFMSEDPLTLDSKARESGSIIVPDCGVAPGLSNMFIGLCSRVMDLIEVAEIIVGGIPRSPRPPLYHSLSWSAEDLLEEYIRPARYIEDYEVKSCNPLSLKIPFLFKGLELEAFPTDGLRTLLRLRKRPRLMRELTVRWKGHLDAVKLLWELGFLDDSHIELQGVKAPIKVLTAKIIERLSSEEDDMIVMEVVVQGLRGGERVNAQLRVYGSVAGRANTMAEITGTVCSTIALNVAQGLVDDVGVIPPEDLKELKVVISKILSELKELGLQVEVEGLSL